MSNVVASEIARQIGNRAFTMMGTRRMFSDGPALIFEIKGSPKRWNKIKVALNALDTYDVTFFRIGRAPGYSVTSHEVGDVYVDMLHDVIERETGLYLSLGATSKGSRS